MALTELMWGVLFLVVHHVFLQDEHQIGKFLIIWDVLVIVQMFYVLSTNRSISCLQTAK